MKSHLSVETLEARDLASATANVVAGVLNIQADDQTNYLVVSTPAPGVTELFDATTKSTRDFTGVTSIAFQAGRGNTTFYNQTVLPSTQRAGNGPATYVLNGGTGNDTLIGGTSPASTSFLSDPAGINILQAGAGRNNLFGGRNQDTLIAGGKSDEIYDILGVNTFQTVGTPTGYLIANAASSVQAVSSLTVITFFSPTTNPAPAMLSQDQFGHGILWLNPVAGQSGVLYAITQSGNGANAQVLVQYVDSRGQQTFSFPKNQVQWIASFGTPGDDTYYDFTDLNDVIYGAAGNDVIVGGNGRFSVLKGHSGNDLLTGRARQNDLSVGPGTSTIFGNQGDVFRPNTGTTLFNVRPGNTVIGPPASIDRTPIAHNPVAQNDDFFQLFSYLRRFGIAR